MAEFAPVFDTWEGSMSLLAELEQTRRYTFVLNRQYARPIAMQSQTLTPVLKRALRQDPSLYLWATEYSRYPPYFRDDHFSTNPFYIYPMSSGPALKFDLPRSVVQTATQVLVPGRLHCQPWYEDPDSGRGYKPPEALKKDYNDLRTRLRKYMVRRYACIRSTEQRWVVLLWIAERALSLMDTQGAVISFSAKTQAIQARDLRLTRAEAESEGR